ncbi:MAG: PHP domain-containing protein [Prolixibacteraceae bacterium]|nr:PHP domain-containing protein [Prolixibacteraceae bacterium]
MNLKPKKLNYFPVALIAFLLFASILFHYSIHFENALTKETLSAFGLHIPFLRIIFEPFLGILLFFNSSLYALTEFIYVLCWLLILFIGYSLVKSIQIKGGQLRKRFLLRQLANLPLIIGLWFVVLIIMIFIPLPNNTIVNNSANTILVNTHSHTEYSHDGLISQENLWKWHKRNGFDAFFITEHNNHHKTLEFVQAQREQKFSGQPLVMCGEEFSGSNHLSLLGLKENFSTKGCADSTVIAFTRADNGAVIVNHWFDGERKTLEYYKNLGVDGFEIENSATDRFYDRKVYQKIKNFCEGNYLIMNGGLDFHGYGNVCSIWNAMEIPGWRNLDPVSKEEAILNIIKTRDQNKLKVVLYIDRPYYAKKNLFFRPLLTFVNYFRTLNFYQVLSWIVWITCVSVISKMLSKNPISKQLSIQRLVPLLGLLLAIFLLGLGLIYFFRIRQVENFTKMYKEYSALLFYVGSAMLVYAGFVAFYRFFKQKE